MSLLDGIASAIGHTPETLAEAAGTSVGMLEKVISGLGEEGIDVFSSASRLGLTPDGLLRGIVKTMHDGDPHQQLLNYLLSPVKPMSDPLASLTSHWLHMMDLHQNTASTIDRHIQDLFSGSGTESYGGPAADTLWNTHQDFQRYFGTLIDHAQTQHTRHKTLNGHMDDYVSQMPSRVNSLSAPAAAFGVLSLEMASAVVPAWGIGPDPYPWPLINPQPLVKERDEIKREAQQEHNPTLEFWAKVLSTLIALSLLMNALDRDIGNHNKQQKQTTTPPPTGTPGTGSGLTPTQQRLLNDVKSRLGNTHYNDADIEALIKAGYTDPDAIAALISGKVTVTGTFDSVREQQDAVKFALRMGGGNVYGPRKRTQGIDFIFTPKGKNEQIPVSLKNWSDTPPDNINNIIGRINRNANKIKGTQYRNVILDATVSQMTSEDMLKFVQNGPIKNMPKEGVFKTLYFHCSDGTVVVDADGARIMWMIM